MNLSQNLELMMMMAMPTGFRFNPIDEELIELLARKVSGQEMHLHDHFMIETDVYELDPQHLQWNHYAALSKNERYYFCLKENDSREVAGQGWWRATGHVKKIYVNSGRGHFVGYKRPLTFHRFRDDHDHQRRRKKTIKTNWIMHEYSLESFSKEWRLCKIKYNGKTSAQEELESIRKAGGNSSASIVAEQQRQPQNLQLDNHVFDCLGAINFLDFSVAENQQRQQQQQQSLQLDDNVYENYNNIGENTQMEATNVRQQQQPKGYYDPYYCFYFDDNHQVEQAAEDFSEQVIPSLWSWQN